MPFWHKEGKRPKACFALFFFPGRLKVKDLRDVPRFVWDDVFLLFIHIFQALSHYKTQKWLVAHVIHFNAATVNNATSSEKET